MSSFDSSDTSSIEKENGVIMNRLIAFKSTKEFYWKEQGFLKNNTARIVDLNDERFIQLKQWSGQDAGDWYIQIMNKDDPEHFFIRWIKDVSFWKPFDHIPEICIITWYESGRL